MNYEMQFKLKTGGSWVYWSTTSPVAKGRRSHIAILRNNFPDRKFRIVRVTRKVVKG